MKVIYSLMLVTALGGFGIAEASPLVSVRGGVTAAAWNRPVGTPYQCGYNSSGPVDGCSLSSTGILTESSSKGDSWYGTPNTAFGKVGSGADNAGLHAFVQMDLNGYPLDNISYANHYSSSFYDEGTAIADMFDTLTVLGPGSGPVDIVFNFDLDGSVYRFGSANAWADVSFSAAGQGTNWRVGNPLGSTSPVPVSETLSYTVHGLTPGQSYNYTLELAAKAVLSETLGSLGPRLTTVDAVADFGNTLKFGSISFQDANGNPLQGFSLSSTSGYDYNQFIGGALAAPEPASIAMFGIGLLTVGVMRRRRR